MQIRCSSPNNVGTCRLVETGGYSSRPWQKDWGRGTERTLD